MEGFEGLWFDCETGDQGVTSVEQCACERECASFLVPFSTYSQDLIDKFRVDRLINEDDEVCLLREVHTKYLAAGLETLSAGFVTLDASRPWIMYWILHGLYLLDKEPVHLYARIVSTLLSMRSRPLHIWEEQGVKDSWGRAYGGGPDQIGHGAPTYAAMLALCTVGTQEAFQSVDRADVYRFFLKIKDPEGGFRIHQDGETDSRSTYTVLAVARILNILTPELVDGIAPYLLSCQTYEGGFGGEPGNEAHGGYNFCTLAGLLILGKADSCDLDGQEGWLLRRQVRLEGGFQGRTNKLVDSCYSFWQGAALAIVNIIRNGGGDTYDMEMYYSANPEGQGQGEGERAHTVVSGSAAVSSEGEIGDTPISELLSGGRNREGGRERDTGERVGDENVQNSRTMFCTPCAVESEVVIEVEGDDADGILESHQIVPVDDRTGALSFNQKALQRYILHCGQQLDGGGLRDKPGKCRDYYHSCYALSGLSIAQSCNISTSAGQQGTARGNALPQVYGDVSNLLRPTSAVFNIGLDKLKNALLYYNQLPCRHEDLLRDKDTLKPPLPASHKG